MSDTSAETESSVPELVPTRNYTDLTEKREWWWINRWFQDNKTNESTRYPPCTYGRTKQEFRERRERCYYGENSLRINYENNIEIGAFIRLTNAYALVASGNEPEIFYNTVSGDLKEIPVIPTSLGGCKIIGRMCVGNKNGLLVPDTVYDVELEKIKNELSDPVKVVKIEENLSALGNVIVCNDQVALIHPDLNKESEEIIADTLQVEVFRTMIGKNPLVGSYCVLNNNGGLLQPQISQVDLENLSSLLQIPLARGTVNCGCNVVGSGLAANDWIAYAGMKTTASEFSVIQSTLHVLRK